MVNARDIVAAASEVYSVTGYEMSSSAGSEIGRVLGTMRGIKDLDGEIDGLYSQLENIDALLNDFNVELSNYMQSLEFDDAEYRSVESRLDVINDIKENTDLRCRMCMTILRISRRNTTDSQSMMSI